MKPDNLLIGIYFHPEAFPPTLNAIGELSECFEKVTVIHRPHLENKWPYPSNVTMVAAGRFITAADQQTASFLNKIGFFFNYLNTFYRQCRMKSPGCILVYDNMSLYAYQMIKRFLKFKHKVWYHNHDVTEMTQLRKYSIGWFAAKAEHQVFKDLDIFSLPSNERLKFFPMQNFKGKYFFIPNYPSRKFYARFYRPRQMGSIARIIYQGQVAPFRGIEQVIPLLSLTIGEHELELAIAGPCSSEYRQELNTIAEQHGVSAKVHFDKLSYSDLPAFTATYNIGMALLSEKNVMTTTIGTASNKLYEYAAIGLPVIYYRSESMVRNLGKFSWAVPADLTAESIRQAITGIINNYEELCVSAHADFVNDLNYETGFAAVKSYLSGNIP